MTDAQANSDSLVYNTQNKEIQKYLKDDQDLQSWMHNYLFSIPNSNVQNFVLLLAFKSWFVTKLGQSVNWFLPTIG